MRAVRVPLKLLAIAFLIGGFWAIGWWAVTRGCIECGIIGGVIVAIVGLALLSTGYLWLTRAPKGRLLVATGRIHLHRRRMLLVASLTGVIYVVLGYVTSHSLLLAVGAGATVGVGVFVVVPIVLWRLLRSEIS